MGEDTEDGDTMSVRLTHGNHNNTKYALISDDITGYDVVAKKSGRPARRSTTPSRFWGTCGCRSTRTSRWELRTLRRMLRYLKNRD